MSPKPAVDEAEMIAFRTAAEFETWLDANVDRHAGVWLKMAKKGSGVPSLTADETVDAVILKLLTARTATARAAQLRRTMSALEGRRHV